MSEVKEAKAETSKGKIDAIHNITRKNTDAQSHWLKGNGPCRHKRGRNKYNIQQIEKKTRRSKFERFKSEVEKFMKREDNSRT